MKYGVFSFNLRVHDQTRASFNLHVAYDGHVDGIGVDEHEVTRDWLVEEGILCWQATGVEDRELYLTEEWMDRTRQYREVIRQGFESGPWHERGPR